MVDKNIKESVLKALNGELDVTNIKEDFSEDVAVICEFIKNREKGIFRFIWNKREEGVDYIRGYNGEDLDYLEDDISMWASKHFEFKINVSLKLNGKEMIK